MNGLITNVAQFWSQLFVDSAALLTDQQGKLANNTFTTDDFIKKSAKYIVDESTNWVRLMGLLTMGTGSTVVLQLPAGAAGPTGDQVLVRPTIGLGTPVTTPMQPLGGKGSGQLTASLIGLDTLSVQVGTVANTSTGDLLAGLVHVPLASGKTVPLATVYLVVT